MKRLFGADNAWDDSIEEGAHPILQGTARHIAAAAHGGDGAQKMLRWLAQPYILNTSRTEFETLLLDIAENAEEWLTSAQTLKLADRTATNRVLPWTQTTPPTPMRPQAAPRSARAESRASAPGRLGPAHALGRKTPKARACTAGSAPRQSFRADAVTRGRRPRRPQRSFAARQSRVELIAPYALWIAVARLTEHGGSTSAQFREASSTALPR